MANPYFAPGQQRAERVRDLFGAIAARYDLLNDLQSFGLHRLWKRKLLRLLAPRPGKSGLDVCTGTGDLAIRMARSGAKVVGLDFSSEMLAVARRKSDSEPNQVSWVQGDARALPFEAGQFDLVSMAYGLRNLPDPLEGLTEIHRILKPGGKVGILDFGRPSNSLWRGIFLSYLRIGVPCFGRWFAGDAAAYAYILESLFHYPDAEAIARLMREAGFEQVRVWKLLGGVMTVHLADRPDSHG